MKHSLLITSSIFCLLILAGFIFLVIQVRETVIQTQEIQKQFAQEQQKTKQIESLRIMTRDIDSIESQLNNMHIEEQHIVDLIKELETLASEEGVVLSLSQLDIIQEKEPHLLMGVDFRGDFENIARALHRFEVLPYVIDLDQVSVAPFQGEDPVIDQWRLVITGRMTSFIPQI
ncbi:MAG: enhanced serine sensitivity protein SseB C-terminal domain-containing protein [Candidatus Pacebacteria bacterium]|nr:enhanced serine sensitivity protein SseB C-terminal domain-containing protein [Candidatus Paceibacterota bacterium]